jgi:hypothetical protein
MNRQAALAALIVSLGIASAQAAVDVNPAQPITRRVTVQLIQTALDNGSALATVFGDSTQRVSIESSIDLIWAQAGIDIAFLPAITRWNDTFAYQGTAGSGTRSTNDLSAIVNLAASEGVLNPSSSVINLIMVNVVPGFPPLSEDTSAGYARVNGNGINGFVGDNLLTFSNGRDVIAGVMAHEIGHNLGLNHTPDRLPNLMSPNGTTEQLDVAQIAIARASRFAISILTPVTGDYNGNGVVDAADYVLWRNTLNQTGTGLAADGNTNDRIDTGDFTIWRSSFGTRNTATGATAGIVSTGIIPVPEPNTALVFAGLMAFVLTSTARNRAR